MVAFNPQISPTNDPNYFKYSDSISQPKADESGGIALKTVGTALEGGVALADTVVKDVIKSDVYSRVDKERDAYSGVLTNMKETGNPMGAQPEVASAVGENGPNPAPVNIMADNTTPVPTAINSGLTKAGTVQSALNGNKISETTYYQRLGNIAKDLRATYPGYREYIDQEISKITGGNPANEYIKSIIQDINRQGSNANKETEFWQHQIVSNAGFPEADKMLQYYKQTGDSNKVMQWLNFNQGQLNVLQLKKAAFEAQGQDRSTQVQNAEDFANAAAMHAATIHFQNDQLISKGGISAAEISDRMAELSLHPEKANDVAYQNLGEKYKALEVAAYNQTMKLLTLQGKGPDGKLTESVAQVIGADKAKAIVDKSVGALFSKTNEFISDKQFSPAYSLQNAAAASQNNALFKLLNDPSVGGRVTTAAALNKAAPNLTPVIVGKLLGDNLDTDLGTFVKEQGKQALAQTGGKYMGADGKVYSFKQSIEELNQASNVSGKPTPGQAFNNLLEIRKAITQDQDPEAKKNAIKYFYDPVNKGSLNKFMDDYYDPAKGGMVKGRGSAFAALTDPSITKAVKNSGDPADWQKYSSWAKGEFATQLGNNVRDLNDINDSKHFKIGWNSTDKKIVVTNADGSPLHGLQETVVNQPYRIAQNLNMGLRNIVNIAKEEGTNVDAYVFKVLRDNGFSPTTEVDGVPAQIMRSMIISNGGKVKDKATPATPVSQFAPEGGGLQDFLTSPAGSPQPPVPPTQPQRGKIKGNLSDQPIDAPIRQY